MRLFSNDLQEGLHNFQSIVEWTQQAKHIQKLTLDLHARISLRVNAPGPLNSREMHDQIERTNAALQVQGLLEVCYAPILLEHY